MILRNLSNRALFACKFKATIRCLRTLKQKWEPIALLLAETYKKRFRMKATAPRIFSTTHFLVLERCGQRGATRLSLPRRQQIARPDSAPALYAASCTRQSDTERDRFFARAG